MLSDEVLERIVERLAVRIEEVNTYTLKKIAKSIKKVGQAKSSDLIELEQILKYGGDYDKIIRKLAKATELNVKDIKAIFKEVAKKDYEFAEKFYKYRNIKYIPFDENIALKNQVDALANITASEYLNMSNTSAIGFSIRDKKKKIIFQNIRDTYRNVVDEAVLSISQGKSTFDEQMTKIIKELATSGLKYVDYKNGRKMRLDSALRMNMRGALRSLHNEMQQQFGEQFDSDGVEISVHSNPAPDHALVQGRQFTTNQYDEYGNLIKKGEFEKFQSDEKAISYDGIVFDPDFEGRDRRSISEYNCYHYIFAIVLDVSKPAYSNEELQEIINKSNEKIIIDGKEYNRYEATQVQRQLESKIREQKDIQMMSMEAGQLEEAGKAQAKITKLTKKYKEVSQTAGLPTYMERMKVSGYKRSAEATKSLKLPTNKSNINYKIADDNIVNKLQEKSELIFKNNSISANETLRDYVGDGYKKINRDLIKAKGDFEKLKDISINSALDVKVLDKLMLENKIDDNLIVYKGTLKSYFDKYKIGEEFPLYMYNSTSLRKEMAEKYLSDYAIELGPKYKDEIAMVQILTPKNTNAIYIGSNIFVNDNELLLDRKLKYKLIKKVETEFKGQNIPEYIIEIIK